MTAEYGIEYGIEYGPRLQRARSDAPVHAVAGEEPSAEVLAEGGALLFLECAEGFTQVIASDCL